jgi:hypothetical protein
MGGDGEGGRMEEGGGMREKEGEGYDRKGAGKS